MLRGHVTNEVRLRLRSLSAERTKVLILSPVYQPHVARHVKRRFELHAALRTARGARGSGLPISGLPQLQHSHRRIPSTRLKQNKRTPSVVAFRRLTPTSASLLGPTVVSQLLWVIANVPSNFSKSLCTSNFLCATFYHDSSVFGTTCIKHT